MASGDQKSRGERERARSAEARSVRGDAREADDEHVGASSSGDFPGFDS